MSKEIVTLELTTMANGGSALGRDDDGRVYFVPHAIPGETVRAEVTRKKERFAQTKLIEILSPADNRVTPPCSHFGVCGGCHFQHIDYNAQLTYKLQVVADQLSRIGGMESSLMLPVIPNPSPYDYAVDVHLSPAGEDGVGFWAPSERRVIPISQCSIMHPALRTLLEDIDLNLPGLRKLTLRVGDDEALQAAFEINGVEPPELTSDMPLSIVIVLPDKTTANLIGDNYVVQRYGGRDFRVSAGVLLPPSPAATELVIEQLISLAALTKDESVVEVNNGFGWLTEALARHAQSVIAIERTSDAIDDAAFNLDHTENVSLYQGEAVEALAHLQLQPDVMVLHAGSDGVSSPLIAEISKADPGRILIICDDAALLARDGKALQKQGYRPVTIQPIDMFPQNFRVLTVSLWKRGA